MTSSIDRASSYYNDIAAQVFVATGKLNNDFFSWHHYTMNRGLSGLAFAQMSPID